MIDAALPSAFISGGAAGFVLGCHSEHCDDDGD